MTVTVKKSKVRGSATPPYSKSYAHRMLICAATANGESTLKGISDSDDIKATLGCIEALGAEYTRTGDTVCVKPISKTVKAVPELYCNESGSTLRFLIPVALALYGKAVFYGTERLISRGIGVYESLFRKKGIETVSEKDRLTFTGRLEGGFYEIPGDVSSQFASGLLLSFPLLKENSTLALVPPVESRPYIGITLDVMSRFGITPLKADKNSFVIGADRSYSATFGTVEGDWSNAASLLVFNLFGGNVKVDGLKTDSIQGDRVCTKYFDMIERGCPTLDVSECPDLAPVLIACAARHNGALLTGTRRLKIKECDRANAMASELFKVGARVDVFENSVRVFPSKMHAPSETLDSHNDHRIVMALTPILSEVGGKISGAEAVCKSFPDYFDKLSALGLEVV